MGIIKNRMVESTNQNGDGIERKYIYANFRSDVSPAPGHTPEIISTAVAPEYYDNLEA